MRYTWVFIVSAVAFLDLARAQQDGGLSLYSTRYVIKNLLRKNKTQNPWKYENYVGLWRWYGTELGMS